jgi:hypothetical protein
LTAATQSRAKLLVLDGRWGSRHVCSNDIRTRTHKGLEPEVEKAADIVDSQSNGYSSSPEKEEEISSPDFKKDKIIIFIPQLSSRAQYHLSNIKETNLALKLFIYTQFYLLCHAACLLYVACQVSLTFFVCYQNQTSISIQIQC